MARAIWKGHLAFGLVSIPVDVHVAVRNHRPRFRLLHARDKSPVKLSRVCARNGTPVAWQEIVKGYQYSRGHFVVLTKEDFASAALEKSRRVDILDFVRADDIDDRFFETPYYLAPGKGGEQSYALLREAMRAANRVGIGKFLLRETMHLAAIEVIDEALVLSLLRFADELVDISTLALPARTELRKQELDMARALVESLASDWQPEKYTDDYRDNLMKIIKAKMKGKTIEFADAAPRPRAEATNLMERLRLSLDAARAQSKHRGSRSNTTPARTRTKSAAGKRASPRKKRVVRAAAKRRAA